MERCPISYDEIAENMSNDRLVRRSSAWVGRCRRSSNSERLVARRTVLSVVAATAGGHPVRLNIPYPESLSRWKIFLKGFMVVPNVIVLCFVLLGFSITTFLAWWAVLFTGKYPKGLFAFGESTLRWTMNVQAYMWLLRDEYPPFSGAAGKYPVEFSIQYPDRMSRILMLFKWLTVIPSVLVFDIFGLVGDIGLLVAWWAILITGNMPRGIHSFLTGLLRMSGRIIAYSALLTDASWPKDVAAPEPSAPPVSRPGHPVMMATAFDPA